MKVLISLTDVEPAVRLNAELERSGVETAVVSPLDDVRGAIRRERPDVIVMTGALVDPQNVALAQRLRRLHIPATIDFYGPGTHSWPYWQRELHRALPLLLRALGGPTRAAAA